MTIRHLDRLLAPKSVVVVGASDRVGSVGATVWRNLRAGDFAGPIYAVNPKRATLDGEAVFARLADLPQAPDLAVLCTPADTVPGLIDELGRLGTRAAIVVTAGLSPAQKQATLDAARPHVLRVLGPNCLGLLSPHVGLNASFAHTDALAGEVAFVSQSGALVTAVLDWAKSRRIGFSHMVSLGERADVDFGDLLDHLASDARTRSILLYVESIEAPHKFMSAARAAARNKPVIVVKAGRAGNGLKAAASHTGALAGSDIVFDAAIVCRHAARGHAPGPESDRREHSHPGSPARQQLLLHDGRSRRPAQASRRAADACVHAGRTAAPRRSYHAQGNAT